MSFEKGFTKDNLDVYLKELAKEYKRSGGRNAPAEIILIGGAAALANYGFRESTYDIDALISASSAMKDAISTVGDRMGLPNGWINTDFERTVSYSPRLIECSQYYRTFSNIVTIRAITSEYLIAMKLRSARQYKNDISDIVGIIAEQKKIGKPISFLDVDKAVIKLYGSWDKISILAQEDLNAAFESNDLSALYQTIRKRELTTRDQLIEIEKKYPKRLTENNLDDVIQSLFAAQKNSKSSKTK
ncbi:MAG: DUF6036 family nucleotidyltransferase [Solobacterium sp.]|jgi:hypothetical protein|nr:DUF6036 family nucleotidyltransferase [Solobacterium sp.]MCH4205392.1 DUF6036 family nucleotidyltransferase [Solobacterium sp.]MCH4226911.1 DUF6036 family nucleotidyltransferase [Solobacterium sp.]